MCNSRAVSTDDQTAARLRAELPAGSQERMKREIGVLMEELSRQSPVVLVIEDVHSS